MEDFLEDTHLLMTFYEPSNPSGIFIYSIRDRTMLQLFTRSVRGISIVRDKWVVCEVARKNDVFYPKVHFFEERRHTVKIFEEINGPHDILVTGDQVLLVGTRNNSVFKIDSLGNFEVFWAPSGDPDSWHLNCLYSSGENLYVSAFTTSSHFRGWENSCVGTGVVYSILEERPVITNLHCPHSPLLTANNTWLICNSGDGTLMEISKDGIVLRSLFLDGWTRGLQVSKTLVYIGVTPTREFNKYMNARLIVVSLDSWEVVHEVELPGTDLYQLQLLDLNTFLELTGLFVETFGKYENCNSKM
ncbi:DUF4915 domain-containing protein [Dyadobacter arcticus]|uniref:Conserved hypothetical protein CHP03032 domain-containing protein n=1 Tax=Dyadobacter arcticus TaxID=1078754 RepID=A0ABX0UMM3_9BACT|nr:DUF4915 domain-containing protein [Dyadobacter arcticus]NIJ52326.1 hypothetical protein [Dyadobacter arcticus]